MLSLYFATVYVVAVCSAESPSISGYSPQASVLRDYAEYTASESKSGESYPNTKASYSGFSNSYVGLGNSPYSKSESTLYMNTAASNNESNGPRSTSLSNGNTGGGSSASASESNLYKAKYANDATINAIIRPSYQSLPSGSLIASPTASSASSSASAGGSSEEARVQSQAIYSRPESSSAYYGPSYKERGGNVESASVASGLHSDYGSAQARPAPLYTGYSGEKHDQYMHSRPSSYNYGGMVAMQDYPTGSRHYVHASYPVSEEATYQGPGQGHATSHPYRSYAMSSPQQSSYSSSKYQSVLGALKSLFGAGSSEAPTSPSHPPSYLAASAPHGYYATPSMQASPSSPYFSSGPSAAGSIMYPTNVAYSKNYSPMRFMSSYALNGASHATSHAAGSGVYSPNKIIVLRDSNTVHGAVQAYPSGASTAGGPLLGSPASSYVATKSKIYAFPPQLGASISSAPSSLSYATGHVSASYPSSASFSTSHGGSTFLGYSPN